MYRIRLPDVPVDLFSNDRTIAFDDVVHLPLFEGKNTAAASTAGRKKEE
jgi:hypothetical protein